MGGRAWVESGELVEWGRRPEEGVERASWSSARRRREAVRDRMYGSPRLLRHVKVRAYPPVPEGAKARALYSTS